jgi:Phage stabilisation protein/Kelch motif
MADNAVRVPLIEPLEPRNASTSSDPKMTNGLVESGAAGVSRAVKRPGNVQAYQGTVGKGQGITNYQNQVYSISGDTLNVFGGASNLSVFQATNAAGFSKRYGVQACGFNGHLYVMGGFTTQTNSPLNDVWTSIDGANWSRITANAPWAARGLGQAIVFNNKMWIMGGKTSTLGTNNTFSDVWSTPDGINWTQTSASAWPGRSRFGLCIFNNLMWVAGGNAGIAGVNNIGTNLARSDVWYSPDGITWTQATKNATWIARYSFAFFPAGGRLRVVGGSLADPFSNATSDQWSSADGITWTRDSSNPFAVAASPVWPVAAFDSQGYDFPIPPPVTVSGGTGGSGAAAWCFSDFDDDDGEEGLDAGPLMQCTFSNVGSGYTGAPTLSFGTDVGFNAQAYAMLDGTSNGGQKSFRYATTPTGVTYLLEYTDNGGTSYLENIWSTSDGITYTPIVPIGTMWNARNTDMFIYGNIWFIGGIDSVPNLYQDVWYITLGGGTFALGPNVANGFYHFNQTSTTITAPLLVFKSTKDLYTFNSALNVLTKDSNVANYPATTVPGLVFLDSTFYVMDPQGRVWNSGLNDPTTWTALGFVAMQNEPSGGVAIAKYQNYVVAFGQWTTEFFWDAGGAPPGSPLLPNTTLPFQIGCAAAESVMEMQGSLVWVGQTKREGQGVYMFDGYSPTRISTPFVDQILQGSNLSTVYAFTVDSFGHSMYILDLDAANITLVYDFSTQLWNMWTSYSLGAQVAITSLTCDPYGLVTAVAPGHPFSDGDPATINGASVQGYNGIVNVNFVDANTFTYLLPASLANNPGTATAQAYLEGGYSPVASCQVFDVDYLQDPSNGKIYGSDNTAVTDNGNPINFTVRTDKWDGGTSEWKFCRRISILGDNAVSNAMLAYTDTDYQSYSRYRTMSLQQGQRATTVQCGRFRRRAFIIRHTAATPYRAEALELEIYKGSF